MKTLLPSSDRLTDRRTTGSSVCTKQSMKGLLPHRPSARTHLLARHFPAALFHAVVPLFYVLAAQQGNLLLAVLPHKRVTALTRKEQHQRLECHRAGTELKYLLLLGLSSLGIRKLSPRKCTPCMPLDCHRQWRDKESNKCWQESRSWNPTGTLKWFGCYRRSMAVPQNRKHRTVCLGPGTSTSDTPRRVQGEP